MEKYTEIMQSALGAVKEYFMQKNLHQVSVEAKPDHTPVTDVDREVNAILCEYLRDKTPEVGWLSEEDQDNQDRVGKELCWIVDPIDGTKELVAGIPEVAVSMALTEHGVPIQGLLFNPMSGEVFPGDHLPMVAKGVLISRTDQKKGLFDGIQHKGFDFEVCGSIAYKLGLVANGCALGTVSVTPKNEWDVAGGLALLKQRGGYAQFFDGRTLNSLQLNQPDTLLPGFVAAQDYTIFLELKELFKDQFEDTEKAQA